LSFDQNIFDSAEFGTLAFDCVFDSAIFDGQVFDTCEAPTPTVVIDTHDGGRQRRHFKGLRKARERLREQIRFALEGPQAVELREALEPVATDSGIPLEARVDVGRLTEAQYQKIITAYEAYREDEEEVEMLLLS
jgi:hypothetical protein